MLPHNFVLILSHRSILTSSNKLTRIEKKRTQQEIIYFGYRKIITDAFKIIIEKIIQSCFKTFMGRIEFKFVLFLFYPTPLHVRDICTNITKQKKTKMEDRKILKVTQVFVPTLHMTTPTHFCNMIRENINKIPIRRIPRYFV